MGSEEPVEGGQGSTGESAAGRQYAFELLNGLREVDPDSLRGEGKFPPKWELRFAPAQFRSILTVASRALSVWELLSHDLAEQIERALIELLNIVTEIDSRASSAPNRQGTAAMATSKDLIDRLKGVLTFFNELEPIIDQLDSHPTSVAEAAPLTEDEVEQIGRLRDELAAAKADLSALNSQNAAVSSELESRAELVEAARTGTGSAGAKDLAMAYEDQANDHVGQWKIWGIALLGTLFIALIGGVLLLELNPPPDDPSTPELVSHLVLDLLVVGLLIYAIRVTSLQFSVHRHLAAVATNKADALKTFSRIVSSGSSAETRDRLAEVLAHHVFVSDSTGFLDVASDQITLPERLVDPIAKRVGGTG